MRVILRTSLSVVSAAALLLAGAAPMQAAGALAIGACAAYGYAYDYPTAEAAQAAAIEKCSGDCKQVVTTKKAASLTPSMDGSPADRTALPTRRGLEGLRDPGLDLRLQGLSVSKSLYFHYFSCPPFVDRPALRSALPYPKYD